MAPSIFALGLSGYIGGDTISQLTATHPEYNIRALVRSLNNASASALRTHFPTMELVEGTLDSLALLASEAHTCDLVLQMADADHLPASLALLRGLAQGGRNGTYIHVSGAANLIDFALPFGVATRTLVRDGEDAALITSLPHERVHARVQQEIIAEGERLGVRTAIVSPSYVHGCGRGVKAYGYGQYLDAVVKHGRAFVVNAGENVSTQINVADLAAAIELLIGAALQSSSSSPSSSSSSSSSTAGWGKEGYYFLEAEEMPFLVQAEVVARLFQKAGLLESSEIHYLDAEAVGRLHQYAGIMWGSSARPRAQKLRALGWEPAGSTRARTLETEIEDYIAARGSRNINEKIF